MDIREKLVELIEESRISCGENGVRINGSRDIADHLLANGVTIKGVENDTVNMVKLDPLETVTPCHGFGEWIPVTERLPKNDYEKPWWERQRYLVRLQGGSMRVATYGYKEADWWIDSHDCVLHVKHHTAVTHWMPLPRRRKESDLRGIC